MNELEIGYMSMDEGKVVLYISSERGDRPYEENHLEDPRVLGVELENGQVDFLKTITRESILDKISAYEPKE
jgi:hypothetical protein|tara:strand:+ start:89 stop:304 length:216 start_codon:yes stop_codon:yes gene_type:complete